MEHLSNVSAFTSSFPHEGRPCVLHSVQGKIMWDWCCVSCHLSSSSTVVQKFRSMKKRTWLYRTIRNVTGTKVPRRTAKYAANVTSRDRGMVVVIACVRLVKKRRDRKLDVNNLLRSSWCGNLRQRKRRQGRKWGLGQGHKVLLGIPFSCSRRWLWSAISQHLRDVSYH